MKYVTVAPALDEFEGRAGIEAVDVTDGSGNDFNYGARISFPLVKDSLGMSLSYARRELPAYIDNVQTGEEDVNEGTQEGARVALLWQPIGEHLAEPVGNAPGSRAAMTTRILMEDINGAPIGDGLSTNLVSRRALREPVRPVLGDAELPARGS